MAITPRATFVPIADRDTRAAGPGELLVLARPGMTRALAKLVVEEGLAAFPKDEGEIETVVVSAEPTLDDMLALEFAGRLIRGDTLPTAAASFASYAGLVREGLTPSQAAMERTVYGLFQALVKEHGSLDTEERGAAFLASWKRLADALWKAIADGRDPFEEGIVDGPQFARERAYLAQDRQVYWSDIERGRRFVGSFPDAGLSAAPILVLDNPKSALFKHWSRSPEPKRPEEAALLLGVRWGADTWVFSTDPAQGLSLRTLAEAFGAAEARKSDGAEGSAWFDGAVFRHTLIGSPNRGTRLDFEEVVSVLSSWAKARPVRRSRRRGWLLGAAAAGIGALAAAGVSVYLSSAPSPEEPVARGSLPADEVKRAISEDREFPSYAVVMCVGKAPPGVPELAALPAACRDAGRVYHILTERFGYDRSNVTALADEPEKFRGETGAGEIEVRAATLDNFTATITALGVRRQQSPRGAPSKLVFYFAGHGVQSKLAASVGHLVFEGYDPKNPDATGFDMGNLERHLNRRLNISHMLLIVDSCFSGNAITSRGAQDLAPGLFDVWKSRARVIITASSDEQRAWEVGDSSVFTSTLLEALGEGGGAMPADVPDTSGRRDGIVTDEELAIFLRKNVASKCGSGTSSDASACRAVKPQHLRSAESDANGQYLFVPAPGAPPR